MINIFSVDEAKKRILRREDSLEPAVPPPLQASLNQLFGEGATPETAVSTILAGLIGALIAAGITFGLGRLLRRQN